MFNFFRKYKNSQIIQTDKPCEFLAKYPLYDFRILDINTYTRNSPNQKDLDHYCIGEMEEFYDDKFYMNLYSIRQVYTIEIFKKEEENNTIDFELKTYKNSTKITAILKTNNILHYYENLKDDLLMSLYKKMIQNKIFIGIRTNVYILDEIENFIENLKKKTILPWFLI